VRLFEEVLERFLLLDELPEPSVRLRDVVEDGRAPRELVRARPELERRLVVAVVIGELPALEERTRLGLVDVLAELGETCARGAPRRRGRGAGDDEALEGLLLLEVSPEETRDLRDVEEELRPATPLVRGRPRIERRLVVVGLEGRLPLL